MAHILFSTANLKQCFRNMQALASTLLARATELARSAALSTWQRFSLSVELINAEVEQAAKCLESEQVQEALALLTRAHQHLSEGLELDEDHPHVDRYTALAEDLQARVLPWLLLPDHL